jgi:hypothetical protein
MRLFVVDEAPLPLVVLEGMFFYYYYLTTYVQLFLFAAAALLNPKVVGCILFCQDEWLLWVAGLRDLFITRCTMPLMGPGMTMFTKMNQLSTASTMHKVTCFARSPPIL